MTWFVCCNLLLALYYDWFRYPFQIGDSRNSLTSRDTPGWISAGKYFIFIFLCFVLLQHILSKRNLAQVRRPACILVYIYLSAMGSVYGLACWFDKVSGSASLLTFSQAEMNRIQLGRFFSLSLFLIAAILLHVQSVKGVDLRPIYKILRTALFIYLLVDALQVLLFVLVGRLPAHGFEGSVSVRFGGLLDQPNDFGILLLLFFGIAAGGQSRALGKVVTIVLLGAAMVLTESFTAWLAASVAVGLYALVCWPRELRLRSLRTGVVLGSIGLIAIAIVWISLGSRVVELYQELWAAKSVSADVHQHSIEALTHSFGVANIFGFEPNYAETIEESGYVNIVLTEGCLYLVIYLAMMAYALFRCVLVLRSRSISNEQHSLAAGAFCFLSAYLVSGLSLAVQGMFPLNLLAAVLMGLSNSGAFENERTA